MKWKLGVESLRDNPTNDRKNIGQKPYGLNLKEVKIVFPIYRNFRDGWNIMPRDFDHTGGTGEICPSAVRHGWNMRKGSTGQELE